ncbi:hypothetical protein EON63_20370 [archaeon]|nr:MAG: hypothetical protein EON63_20370 [archaeon]
MFSKNDAMQHIRSLDLPPMKPMTTTLKQDTVEYLLYKNILFRVRSMVYDVLCRCMVYGVCILFLL